MSHQDIAGKCINCNFYFEDYDHYVTGLYSREFCLYCSDEFIKWCSTNTSGKTADIYSWSMENRKRKAIKESINIWAKD